MRSEIRLVVAATFTALLFGCAPAVHPHTSTWYFEDINPIVNHEVRPGYGLSQKRTFTVWRLFGTDYATGLSEIAEQQALVALTYQFEAYGYTYVDDPTEADLVIAVDYARNEYQTSYVPPSSTTIPVWVPGQTFTSNTTASAYGTGGYARGSATTTTTTPGYMTTRTYTRPGYTSGAYYPSFRITVFDAGSEEVVYSASYVGVSQIQDVRVAFPFAATWMLDRLPVGSSNCQVPMTYRVGFTDFLGTLDGNRYFPVVSSVDPEISLVDGELQILDIITAINGRPVEGASRCAVFEALDLGRPGNVSFTVFRGGETLEVVAQKRLR